MIIESIYYEPEFSIDLVDLYDPEGWIKNYKNHWRSRVKYIERIEKAYLNGSYMEPIWVSCNSQMTRVDDRVGDARYFVIVQTCKSKVFPAIVFNERNAKQPYIKGVELYTEDDIQSYYSFAGLDVRFDYDADGNLVRVKPTRKVCSGWEKFPLLDGESELPEITRNMLES